MERKRRVEEAGFSLVPDCPFRSLVPGTVEPGFGGARTSDPAQTNPCHPDPPRRPAVSQGQKGQQKKKTSSKAKPRQGRVVEVLPLESLRQINPNAAGVDVHKMAKIFYRMLPYGEAYVDQGEAAYTARYREQQLQQLKRM